MRWGMIKGNKKYRNASESLMRIADQLEQLEICFEGEDNELAERFSEIWDDIYDIIIYETIPKSFGTDFNTLMKAIHDQEG